MEVAVRVLRMKEEVIQGAVAGGSLIGIAIALYYAIFGRNLRIPSPLYRFKWSHESAIALTTYAGLAFCGAFFMQLSREHYFSYYPLESSAEIEESSTQLLIVGGFMVGLGSVLAGGGAYTHIYSGLPKFNKASLFASILMLGSVWLSRRVHLDHLVANWDFGLSFRISQNIPIEIFLNCTLIIPFLSYVSSKDKSMKSLIKYLTAFTLGIIAGMGMLINGQINREAVLSTMEYDRHWSPRFLLSMVSAIVVNMIVYLIMKKKNLAPVFAVKTETVSNEITFSLVLGSIIFGVGWGLSALTPEPCIVLLAFKVPTLLIFWGLPSLIGATISSYLYGLFERGAPIRRTNV